MGFKVTVGGKIEIYQQSGTDSSDTIIVMVIVPR